MMMVARANMSAERTSCFSPEQDQRWSCLPAKFSPSRVVRPSGLFVSGSLLSVLWPRLTPVPAQRPLLAAVPTVAGGLGRQASLSKNVNSRCTTGPFISGTEHGTALWGASLSAPSTLYGRGLARARSLGPAGLRLRRIPFAASQAAQVCSSAHQLGPGASFPRNLTIPQLPRSNVWAIVPLVMRGPTTVFTHRGLSPHQFTPMSGAHHRPGADGGWRFLFASVGPRSRAAQAERWA